jgi:hypothetical protein
MAEKIGSEFAREQLDRGRREIGGFFFPDSNIAQPNYPLRGPIIGREIEAPTVDEREISILNEHQQPGNQRRDEKDRDDGMDRE